MQERASNAGRTCCGYEWIANKWSVACVGVGRVLSVREGDKYRIDWFVSLGVVKINHKVVVQKR